MRITSKPYRPSVSLSGESLSSETVANSAPFYIGPPGQTGQSADVDDDVKELDERIDELEEPFEELPPLP